MRENIQSNIRELNTKGLICSGQFNTQSGQWRTLNHMVLFHKLWPGKSIKYVARGPSLSRVSCGTQVGSGSSPTQLLLHCKKPWQVLLSACCISQRHEELQTSWIMSLSTKAEVGKGQFLETESGSRRCERPPRAAACQNSQNWPNWANTLRSAS